MFENGDILKVKVASHSHVIEPYYVLVENGGGDGFSFTTSIPNVMKRLWCNSKAPEYEYHKDRCSKVGTMETHGYLLYNQKLRMNGKTIYSANTTWWSFPKNTNFIKRIRAAGNIRLQNMGR
jgi:hypothetical protein